MATFANGPRACPPEKQVADVTDLRWKPKFWIGQRVLLGTLERAAKIMRVEISAAAYRPYCLYQVQPDNGEQAGWYVEDELRAIVNRAEPER